MIKRKKSIIIYGLAAIGGPVALLLIFRAVLFFAVPEKTLKESVTVFFKDNFNRAVKFDDISFSTFGNVAISKLSVSVSSDFNDNQHILRADKTIVHLSLFRLLRGSLLVRKIEFNGAEIAIAKKLGLSYAEFFSETIRDARPPAEMMHADPGAFDIELNDTTVTYAEGINDKRLSVEMTDVRGGLSLTDGRADYEIRGKVMPGKTRDISPGKFTAKGELKLDGKSGITGTKNSIELDNVDLSHLNVHSSEEWESNLAYFGGFSAELKVGTLANETGIQGSMRFNNLNILQGEGEGAHSVVANENLNIDLTADILDDFDKIVFRDLRIYDDNLKLSVTGALASGELERYIDLSFSTNQIKLSELSLVFSPLRGVSYGGTASAQGKVFLDLSGKKTSSINVTGKVESLSLWRGTPRAKSYIIKNADATLVCTDDAIEFNSMTDRGGADLSCSVKSVVSSWRPFRSRTGVEVKGRSAMAGDAWFLISRMSEWAIKSAFEDKLRGFEEILFRKRPAGIFANNNSISIECAIDRLSFGESAAALTGFKTAVRLDRGVVQMDSFALSGYGGTYTMELQSFLNGDYANIKLKGGVEKFDVGRFYKDMKAPGRAKGECAIRFDYEASGYRMAHLVETGKGDITIRLADGDFKETSLQRKLAEFLSGNNFPGITPEDIQVEKATITLAQKSDSFFLRNLTIESDRLNFRAFGPYSFYFGFQLPIALMFTSPATEPGSPPRIMHVPVVLRGHALDPLIAIQKGADAAEFHLLDVD
ncbi:MAG: hypothetical protein EPN93_19110 [Spirochaetes bacterium]|nr:MAG: hypothetical protein EPN93_19110 [Spirochaetota bacterium]